MIILLHEYDTLLIYASLLLRGGSLEPCRGRCARLIVVAYNEESSHGYKLKTNDCEYKDKSKTSKRLADVMLM
jgi:hypothetical protein